MRGGAIPLVVWGILLLILLVINWIWEGTGIHVGLFGFAVLAVVAFVAVLALISTQALRRGPPERRAEPEALPRASLAAAGVGLAVGVIGFGLEFGRWLVFLGGGLLLVCLGRLGRELIWQARSLSAYRRQGRR